MAKMEAEESREKRDLSTSVEMTRKQKRTQRNKSKKKIKEKKQTIRHSKLACSDWNIGDPESRS
jgi:hypothetical protein